MASCVKTESKKPQTATGNSDCDPENKTQGNTEVDGNEERNLESKDSQDKHTQSTGKEEASSESGDSDESSGSWYYDIYDMEEASKYPSQACFNIRGVSYTPPGWKRVYKKLKM